MRDDKRGPTRREIEALVVIVEHRRRTGVSPMMAELGEALGCRASWAHVLTVHLRRMGLLRSSATGTTGQLWPTEQGTALAEQVRAAARTGRGSTSPA
jgi:hypothetical protein